jgi:putative peptide zinc metalloprotease protein
MNTCEHTSPGTSNPKRVGRVEVSHGRTSRGVDYHVLHNPEVDTYLEIDARNFFLWELMKGEHSLADIALAYHIEFGTFPMERLSLLITQLKANYLLERKSIEPSESMKAGPPGLLEWLARNALQKEFDWKHADDFCQAIYLRGGKRLFTRPALFLMAGIALVGFVCFIYLEPHETFQLFHTGWSYGIGIGSLLVAQMVMIFCHELGHALTCKRYGRRIRKAGFMFYLGMPAFFVDTTDIWMEKRSARVAVSLAGPVVNLVLAGFISILVMALPASGFTASLFQIAYLGYLAVLFNLNPLLDLDGYYVLMDLLEMPQLRKKSLSFVKTDLLGKIMTHGAFGREGLILSIYGILAILCSTATVLLSIYLWENEIRILFRDITGGGDLLALVLISGLALAAGTSLVLGLGARLLLLVKARIRRAQSHAHHHCIE